MTNGYSNKIGDGSFGDVYKGTFNDVFVAVKKLRDVSEKGLKTIRTEFDALCHVKWPGIISIYGGCFEDGHICLVYEYAHGGALLHQLGNLTALQCVKIAIQIANALSFLHSLSHPIVHRDVKSSNILLTDTHTALLSDFGIARVIEDGVVQQTYVTGTQGYADPMYIRTGTLTTASDVYSFGVVLLELMCSKPVLVGNSSLTLQYQRLLKSKEDIPSKMADLKVWRNDYAERLSSIIEHCLRSLPEDRCLIGDVAQELQALLSVMERDVLIF
jgi:serine/threonine protein kinase